MMLSVGFVLVLFAAGEPDVSNAQPEQLLKRVLAERAALRTCRITYRVEKQASETAPSRVETYALSLAANGDRKLQALGDDEGVTLRLKSGEPHDVWGHGAREWVMDSAQLWMREDLEQRVVAFAPDRVNNFLADPRTIGLTTGMNFVELSDAMAAKHYGKNPRWSATREGDLICVALATDDATISRWIDPTRGWNLVRIDYKRGEVHRAAEIELQKSDGAWFPSLVRVLSGPNLDTVRETIQVVSAEFNRPDHPADFKLSDIGIVDGASVQVWSNDNTPIEYGVVQSGRYASLASLAAQSREAVDAEDGAEALGASRLREVLQKPESLWERYVRRRIAAHKLNDDQQRMCWAILRDCQEAAQSHFNRKKSESDAVLRDMDVKGDAAADGRAKELTARLDALIEPINRIFETRLKPRVDDVVTKAQRAKKSP